MALWKRLFAHPGFERLKTLYNDQFPLEVRFVCAEWIEEQMKIDQFVDYNSDPHLEQRAANFMRSLIDQLEKEKEKFKNPDQMSIKYRIEGAIRMFTENLFSPFHTYKHIRDAIMYEQHFLDNLDENPQFNFMDNEAIEINEKLRQLHNAVLANKEKQNQYNHELESCETLEYNESAKIYASAHGATPEAEERRLRSLDEFNRKKYAIQTNIERIAVDLMRSLEMIIIEINGVQKKVILTRLGRWQRDQALSGNGAPLPINALDEIQVWFEKLAELIWTTRNSIDAIRKLNAKFNMNMDVEIYYKNITDLLQELIVSGFIVEKQPPQVMKTNTRFAATVRLLTANVGIQMNNPSVSVSILSENQAQLQQNNNTKALEEASGEILNNSGNLEIQQASRHLTCNLRNMQLKKIKRAEKKGTESVMDEKFALLFKSTFQCADVQINVWVMSLPVVVIVHGNQEPQSWATITWDNAFSDISRIPFNVVDRVNWARMSTALNTKFTCQTGRGLTNENLFYLCEKAFRAPTPFNADERPITWSQFCKEPLPDRTFTFWDWFYAVMKLTRDQLRGPWTEGLIIGFISKREAEEKLKKCLPGTFLLRFSDSELGGITIAWIEHTIDNMPQIVMLQPFCHKDFAIRTLGDRIKDLTQCVTLYPDIPKDKAFGAYYTPIGVINNGYVKPELKLVVDKPSSLNSYPNTPQRNWQSPDHVVEPASVGSDFYSTLEDVQEIIEKNVEETSAVAATTTTTTVAATSGDSCSSSPMQCENDFLRNVKFRCHNTVVAEPCNDKRLTYCYASQIDIPDFMLESSDMYLD